MSCSSVSPEEPSKAVSEKESSLASRKGTVTKARPDCWIDDEPCPNDISQFEYFSGEGIGKSKKQSKRIARIHAEKDLSYYLVTKVEAEIRSIHRCTKNDEREVCESSGSQKIVNRTMSYLQRSVIHEDDYFCVQKSNKCYFRIKIKKTDLAEMLKYARQLMD